jgi:hypothetical protein
MAKNDSIEAIEDTTPVKARSLAEITGAMGAKLETIKGEKVTVTNLTFDVRDVHKLDDNGRQLDELESKEVVFIWTGPETRYYSFSQPLIDKLKEVDIKADLPAEATFDIKDISGGRRVWTIS